MDELSAEDGYQELTLDVTGVQVLEFETRNSGEGGNPVVFLSDTLLTGRRKGKEAAEPRTLKVGLSPDKESIVVSLKEPATKPAEE